MTPDDFLKGKDPHEVCVELQPTKEMNDARALIQDAVKLARRDGVEIIAGAFIWEDPTHGHKPGMERPCLCPMSATARYNRPPADAAHERSVVEVAARVLNWTERQVMSFARGFDAAAEFEDESLYGPYALGHTFRAVLKPRYVGAKS